MEKEETFLSATVNIDKPWKPMGEWQWYFGCSDWLQNGVYQGRCIVWNHKQPRNHRIIQVGRDLQIHLAQPPAMIGISLTRSSCSKHHPTFPWTRLGMRHWQLLWATCSCASPSSKGIIFSFYLSKLALLQFKAIFHCPIITCPSKKAIPFPLFSYTNEILPISIGFLQ